MEKGEVVNIFVPRLPLFVPGRPPRPQIEPGDLERPQDWAEVLVVVQIVQVLGHDCKVVLYSVAQQDVLDVTTQGARE